MPNLPRSLPAVPVGFGTKLGTAAAAVAGLIAALSAVLDGDHSNDTIGALVAAAIAVYGVVRSRGEQAAALYAASGPAPQAPDRGDLDELDDEHEPADDLHPLFADVPEGPTPIHDEGDGAAGADVDVKGGPA